MKTIVVRSPQVIDGVMRAVGEIVSVADTFADPFTETVSVDNAAKRQKDIVQLERDHAEKVKAEKPKEEKPKEEKPKDVKPNGKPE